MDSRMEAELHRVNERYIAILVWYARHDGEVRFELVGRLKDQLLALDDASRCLAAERTHLLLDFRFNDHQWWLQQSANANATPQPWNSAFPRHQAVELARRALTIAWHASQLHVPGATAKLGLSRKVSEVLVRLRLEDFDRIADSCILEMRPRWENRPALWHRLLEAAKRGDTQALQAIDLHGAQLLAADLMSVSTTKSSS